MKKATLILGDGTRFEGESFGYDGNVAGEVVFNTAMTGYPESLTDPSYAGQLRFNRNQNHTFIIIVPKLERFVDSMHTS